MKQLRQWGGDGESMARNYLSARGYRWLASNFSTRWGEIDLIMEQGGTLVFVEVKRRASARYGAPEEAVTRLKARRMVRSALLFVQKHRLDGRMMRFDTVAIGPDGLRHIADFFQSDEPFYY